MQICQLAVDAANSDTAKSMRLRQWSCRAIRFLTLNMLSSDGQHFAGLPVVDLVQTKYFVAESMLSPSRP